MLNNEINIFYTLHTKKSQRYIFFRFTELSSGAKKLVTSRETRTPTTSFFGKQRMSETACTHNNLLQKPKTSKLRAPTTSFFRGKQCLKLHAPTTFFFKSKQCLKLRASSTFFFGTKEYQNFVKRGKNHLQPRLI